jgi:hypothetical protein
MKWNTWCQSSKKWCMAAGVSIMACAHAASATDTPATAPADVHVHIAHVQDHRSTEAGGYDTACTVTLEFRGPGVANALYVKSLAVTAAVDDLGKDLARVQQAGRPDEMPALTEMMQKSAATRPEKSLEFELKLDNPSRSAKRIARIEGDVQLYVPSPEKGQFTLPNFLAHPGTVVPSPALEKQNIKIIYLPASEAANAKLPPDFGDLKDDIEQMLFMEKQTAARGTDAELVPLVVHDPEHKVLHTVIMTSAGPALGMNTGVNDKIQTHMVQGHLPKDASLVVYVDDPAAIQTAHFVLKDVTLP